MSKWKPAAVALPILLWGIVAGFYVRGIAGTPSHYWLHHVLAYTALPILSLIVLVRVLNVSAKEIGFTSFRPQYTNGEAVAGLFLFSLAGLSFFFVQGVAWRMVGSLGSQGGLPLLVQGHASTLIAAVYLAVVSSFFEEVFFRGVLAYLMLSRSPTMNQAVCYVVTSGLLFGANHWGLGVYKVLATFYLGVVFATIFLKTRNIWFVVVPHLVVNFFSAFV